MARVSLSPDSEVEQADHSPLCPEEEDDSCSDSLFERPQMDDTPLEVNAAPQGGSTWVDPAVKNDIIGNLERMLGPVEGIDDLCEWIIIRLQLSKAPADICADLQDVRPDMIPFPVDLVRHNKWKDEVFKFFIQPHIDKGAFVEARPEAKAAPRRRVQAKAAPPPPPTAPRPQSHPPPSRARDRSRSPRHSRNGASGSDGSVDLHKLSKALSAILRHGNSREHLDIYEDGYAPLDKVMLALRFDGITERDIDAVVEWSVKDGLRRFELSVDWRVDTAGAKIIRATEGHSIQVSINGQPAASRRGNVNLDRVSIGLTGVLRHDGPRQGLRMSHEGFALVHDVIAVMRHPVTEEIVRRTVEASIRDGTHRFELRDGGPDTEGPLIRRLETKRRSHRH